MKLHPSPSGLRTTSYEFVQSLKKLIGVFVLTVLTLSFLALLGLEFFQGILRRKCIIIPPQPPNKTSDPDYYGYDTSSGLDDKEYLNHPGTIMTCDVCFSNSVNIKLGVQVRTHTGRI